ncbi:MAG: Universal stress protein family protein [Bacteroidetes bacterium ADurb.Bin408]|nr:MAG: Universal stress protein family protein [Bacteroidetes bacterium ADurb.Bin408]
MLSIVAIIGKWIAAFITQKVLRYNAMQRRLIFGLSSSHAAAILAVILVGYNAKILDDNILNGTIILILITCIVASIVTENAAKKILITEQQNPDDNKDEILNEHILLPIANITNIEHLLDFALYIKNNKSPNPVSILSCIPNDENAENNVLITKGELERFVRQASAREKKANIIITLDHNPASGIARTSKEIMADIIIIGWPRKQGMLDKIIGDKVENIINNTDKTIFICQLNRPFVNHKRLIVIAPPHAEKESGFIIWLSKIHTLATELNLPVILYSNNITSQATAEILKHKTPVLPFNTVYIDAWEDLLIAKDIRKDDIIVLTLARKGSLSFMNQLEQIPDKLEKHYPVNTKILIYPQRYSHHYKVSGYEGYASGTINKGIATIQKLGKDIGSLLKSEKKK